MEKYIKKNSDKAKKKYESYFIHDKPLHVLEPLSNPVDLNYVTSKIEERLPSTLLRNFDNIYVGRFEELVPRKYKFNALYKDRTIYASADQDNEEDLIDDLIHEIAHSLEESESPTVYDDGSLEREFLGKRKALYHELPRDKRAELFFFLNPDYEANFDLYLYKTLGYDALRTVSANMFYSPYAITSLREYWANGFENYFLGDRQKLKDLSPVLYNKILTVIENNKEK